MRKTNHVYPGQAANAPAGAWVTTSISTYPDELAALDAAVKQLSDAGVRGMNRSRLIRIAVKKLDVQALAAELKGLA